MRLRRIGSLSRCIHRVRFKNRMLLLSLTPKVKTTQLADPPNSLTTKSPILPTVYSNSNKTSCSNILTKSYHLASQEALTLKTSRV